MARYRGTTKERGLGAAHQADRERLLAQHHDGDLCWRCGQPMYKWQDLDRDHVIDRVLGGTDGPAVLAHAVCNRSAGARLSNQVRPQRTTGSTPEGRDTTCKTCGKRYWYAARACQICRGHYHPHYSGQRSCSRACGVVLTRRNRVANGWIPPEERPKPPKPSCVICGSPCSRAYSKFCSTACRRTARADVILQASPSTPVEYYNCRYCGGLGIATAQRRREVCPARACQLARLAANNLRLRQGLTSEQADAAVIAYRAEGDHRPGSASRSPVVIAAKRQARRRGGSDHGHQ